LARHGFDRPLDYRRLRWSHWFRCESHHSLLFVPSKPGVFALAEEIIDFGPGKVHVGAAAPGCPAEQSSAAFDVIASTADVRLNWEGHEFSPEPALSKRSAPKGAEKAAKNAASAVEGICDGENRAASIRRLLAVTQFFEDEDMAFVLDRMLSQRNPMSARLSSGRYFVRFVVIEDPIQRHSICAALNQWIVSAAEKATGIGSHFASSLELTPADAKTNKNENENVARATAPGSSADASVGRTLPSTSSGQAMSATADVMPTRPRATAPHLNSGAAANIHCPSPFPSGF
jgi:hypothetical protein